MWGVTLMIVGALSFVLPLAGRQFVLVSALGLTGANSVLVGVVVFAIGLVLFLSGGKGHPGTTPRAVPTNSPNKPPGTRTSQGVSAPISIKAEEEWADTSPIDDSSRDGRFALEDSGFMDAYDFGLGLVASCLRNSQEIVVGMVGTEEFPSQRAIKANAGPVQLHALALILSVYYFCANRASKVDKEALNKVAMGMVDGLAAIFSPQPTSESARGNALSVYELVKDYTRALAEELSSIDQESVGDNPLDMGSTARLVVHNIGGQCGIQESLAESHLERLMLEKIARDCGIIAMMKVLASGRVSYSRA